MENYSVYFFGIQTVSGCFTHFSFVFIKFLINFGEKFLLINELSNVYSKQNLTMKDIEQKIAIKFLSSRFHFKHTIVPKTFPFIDSWTILNQRSTRVYSLM